MVRNIKTLFYLDTHVMVRLYAGLVDKLTETAMKAIDESELLVSRIVRLELQYIYNRSYKGQDRYNHKQPVKNDGLKKSDIAFNQIIEDALKISWTRDVFDRLVLAEAKALRYGLVSADRNILINFKQTIW